MKRPTPGVKGPGGPAAPQRKGNESKMKAKWKQNEASHPRGGGAGRPGRPRLTSVKATGDKHSEEEKVGENLAERGVY